LRAARRHSNTQEAAVVESHRARANPTGASRRSGGRLSRSHPSPRARRAPRCLRLSVAAAALLLVGAARAQGPLPVLRSNATTIDVEDGGLLREDHWVVLPDVPLDVYHARRSSASKRVTFRSDVDSLSFDVEPGREYDFVVLLEGRVECRTRISTRRASCRPVDPAVALDAPIPFELASDGKIHVRARIGGSEPLDLMFDTGADTVVLYDSGLAKVGGLRFDGTIENAGLGGRAVRRTSSDNALAVGHLRWDHELVMHVERDADAADGILGYEVFEDRVVEIDFDRRELRIHARLPASVAGHSRHALRRAGTLTAVEATLIAGGASVTDWLILDTGAASSLQLAHAFALRHGLLERLEPLGRSFASGVGPERVENVVALLPTLRFGGVDLARVPVHVVADAADDHVANGLIGIEVLARFHAVLDYPGGEVYLKPGAAWDAPFEAPRLAWSTTRKVAVVGALAATFAALVALLVRRRSRIARARPRA